MEFKGNLTQTTTETKLNYCYMYGKPCAFATLSNQCGISYCIYSMPITHTDRSGGAKW